MPGYTKRKTTKYDKDKKNSSKVHMVAVLNSKITMDVVEVVDLRVTPLVTVQISIKY